MSVGVLRVCFLLAAVVVTAAPARVCVYVSVALLVSVPVPVGMLRVCFLLVVFVAAAPARVCVFMLMPVAMRRRS